MDNIIVKNSGQILSTSLLKAHLRTAHEHEDEYLEEVAAMAMDALERMIGKALLIKTFCCFGCAARIVLPFANVQKILSVCDQNTCEPIPFRFADNVLQLENATTPVAITYTAGITDDAAQIPGDLKLAALQIAKNIYDCEDFFASKTLQPLIKPYLTHSL